MRKCFIMVVFLCTLWGCSDNENVQDVKAKECASGFAKAYFNFDFKKAQQFVTPESVKWLQFAASNVSQEDVNLLNEQEGSASVDIASLEYVNDSVSVATVEIQSFLQKDSIGKAGLMTEQALFLLKMVKRNDKYYVRMEGLPRSERQSHD